MWQRFTERARRVVFFAQTEAQQRGESIVSTEHLLLGLLHEQDSVACHLLDTLGVVRADLRADLEQKLPPRTPPRSDTELGLSVRAKRVIDRAYDEALQLSGTYIGSEHLLLGILSEGEGLAGRILEAHGAPLEAVRAVVRQLQAEPEIPGWAHLTERGRRVLGYAQEEAKQLGQSAIATEHLLLALTREKDTVAAGLLAQVGISLQEVRRLLERHLARGSAEPDGDDPKLSHTSRRVLTLAFDESQKLKSRFVGTEHLLLGLLREGSGLASHTLDRLGVRLESLRQELKKAAEAPPPPITGTPTPPPSLTLSPLVQALFPLVEAEARLLGEHYASTEHLLLGLVRTPHPTITQFLAVFQVSPERVLQELNRFIVHNLPSQVEEITLTPRARRVFELAYNEAQTQGVAQVELVHLLRGLLREREGLGGRVLTTLGVSLTPSTLSPDALAERLLALGAEVLRLAPYLAELPAEEFRAALLGDTPENLL